MYVRDLGEALRRIMDDRSWTQTRLGRELGVSQSWVSRAMNGVLDPGTRAASRLLAKVGWELRIAPKTEEDVSEKREFVAKAASVLFVPSPKTTPFDDPRYRCTAGIDGAGGGESLTTALLGQARRIQVAAAESARELQLAASELMRQVGQYDIALKLAGNALVRARKAEGSDEQAAAHSVALGIIPDVESADVICVAGNALRDTRTYQNAVDALDESACLSAPFSPYLQANCLGDQALIALMMREPSRAASLMRTLAYVVPLVDSTEVHGQVRHILRQSQPWAAVRDVRAAREQLRSVIAWPPAGGTGTCPPRRRPG